MVSQSHLHDPFIHQRLPGQSFPILFEVGGALATQPAAVVMAEATFQRLVTGSIQFAAVVLEKSTAISGKLIGGNRSLASFERRREHTKGEIWCNLEHYTITQTCFDDGGSLFNRPPTWTCAVAKADLAAARLGRRILLGQRPLRSDFLS